MKKIVQGVTAFVVIVFGSMCSAEVGQWRISPAVGYATVDLGDLNDYAVDFAKSEAAGFVDYLDFWGSIGSAKWDVEKATSGYVGSIDLGYQIASQGGLGARLGYLTTGDITMKVTGSGDGGESIKETGTIEMSAISLLVGGWIEGGDKSGMNYSGYLYVGPTFATSETAMEFDFVDTGLGIEFSGDYSYEAKGSGLGAEIGGKVGYGFNERTSVFVEGGYRMQTIEKMKATEDVDTDDDGIDDIEEGDTSDDMDGDPVEVVLSGISLKVGVQYLF